MKHQMVLKQLDGRFLVTIELNDGTSERVGFYPTIEKALDEFVKAKKRLCNEVVDPRTVMVFEAINHPQYKMIRIK